MERQAAERILSKASSARILVLGDFILDQFVWGSVTRISPEAPVPVVDVQKESYVLGGAGNVAMNVMALGASPIPLGTIGTDAAGERLWALIAEHMRADGLLKSNRPTTLKTRIIAHQQQVVRVDREERAFIEESVQAELAAHCIRLLPQVDALIVSDYSKGTITPALLGKVLPEAARAGKLVCVDPKPRYFSSYSPATVVTPNQAEASAVLGYPIVTEEDLQEAGRRILKLIDCKALLVTRGDRGMALFSDGEMKLVPTRAREVYDVTGAGDTVIAALSVALAGGADILSAVRLANTAAGVVVGKVGTATVSPQELLSQL